MIRRLLALPLLVVLALDDMLQGEDGGDGITPARMTFYPER